MQQGKPQPGLSRPPSYTTIDPSSAPGYEHEATIERAPSSLHLHRTRYGIEIFDPANLRASRYYVGRYQVLDHPDVILHRGPDKSHPIVGQATFDHSHKDFVISVDESARTSADRDEIVRCMSNAKFFSHDSYQFTIPVNSHAPEKSLVWKHTHNAQFGSSAWRPKDFKLAEEATGEVVAVYISLSDTDSEMGRLDWKVSCSVDEEMRALVVLMALFERIRRSKKQAGRAVVVGAARDLGSCPHMHASMLKTLTLMYESSPLCHQIGGVFCSTWDFSELKGTYQSADKHIPTRILLLDCTYMYPPS